MTKRYDIQHPNDDLETVTFVDGLEDRAGEEGRCCDRVHPGQALPGRERDDCQRKKRV